MRERRGITYHRRRGQGDEGEQDRGGGGGWSRWVEGRRQRRWEDQAELQVFQGDGAIGTRTEGRREHPTGAVFFQMRLRLGGHVRT